MLYFIYEAGTMPSEFDPNSTETPYQIALNDTPFTPPLLDGLDLKNSGDTFSKSRHISKAERSKRTKKKKQAKRARMRNKS